MKPLQRVALHEPLVDTVDAKAIATTSTVLKEIDILTVQKSDLAFTSSFSLSALRNDYIHALISWFDVRFTQCHKPISFSTGPHVKYTSWKQTE